MSPARINWSEAPCVFVVLPCCPLCGESDYVSFRSEQNGDGTKTLKAVCRRCSGAFKIVREKPDGTLPENGNLEI